MGFLETRAHLLPCQKHNEDPWGSLLDDTNDPNLEICNSVQRPCPWEQVTCVRSKVIIRMNACEFEFQRWGIQALIGSRELWFDRWTKEHLHGANQGIERSQRRLEMSWYLVFREGTRDWTFHNWELQKLSNMVRIRKRTFEMGRIYDRKKPFHWS